MKEHWLKDLEQRLFSLQDLEYKSFHCRLMPTVDPGRVIGIRTPALRAFAKEFTKQPEAAQFLSCLPHDYYEENNLHGFLISAIKDTGKAISELNRFLPYVDNWATCDMISPKAFGKESPLILPQIRAWMGDSHTYTIRFGIGMLLKFYLDERFSPEHLDWVAEVCSEEYYVRMMAAWYFATALAKQYDAALPYMTERRLPAWTHNKAIQKAIESNRIPPETKAFLRNLKV